MPGETYLSFLSSILTFLSRNPKEMVVVELKKDGFVLSEDKFDKEGEPVANSMVPTVEAFAEAGKKPYRRIGSASELDSKIGSLIETNKRLFIIDRVRKYTIGAWEC